MNTAQTTTVSGFGARLRRRRDMLGLGKQALAAAVGVSLTTIQQYESGQLPKGQHAVRLCAALRCSLDWLLAGKGDEEAGVSQLVSVPLVEARLPAGAERLDAAEAAVRQRPFLRDFLRRRGNPSCMVLLRVSGDSMRPDILHNDMVLIDQSQTDPIPGRVYAVAVEGMIYLKLLDALPGKLVLHSANASYPPIEADSPEQMGGLVRVLGRVVWLERELA